LLDAAAQLTHADGFKHIIHTAAEFLFRPGTAGREHRGKGDGNEERHGVSHTIFNLVDEPKLRRIRRL
jgi:hypothetical protein